MVVLHNIRTFPVARTESQRENVAAMSDQLHLWNEMRKENILKLLLSIFELFFKIQSIEQLFTKSCECGLL